MNEQNYSKRELDNFFNQRREDEKAEHTLLQLAIDTVKKQLDLIDGKVSYTNGKVRYHEKMLWTALGFCLCSTVVLIPVLIALISAGKL